MNTNNDVPTDTEASPRLYRSEDSAVAPEHDEDMDEAAEVFNQLQPDTTQEQLQPDSSTVNTSPVPEAPQISKTGLKRVRYLLSSQIAGPSLAREGSILSEAGSLSSVNTEDTMPEDDLEGKSNKRRAVGGGGRVTRNGYWKAKHKELEATYIQLEANAAEQYAIYDEEVERLKNAYNEAISVFENRILELETSLNTQRENFILKEKEWARKADAYADSHKKLEFQYQERLARNKVSRTLFVKILQIDLFLKEAADQEYQERMDVYTQQQEHIFEKNTEQVEAQCQSEINALKKSMEDLSHNLQIVEVSSCNLIHVKRV